MEFGLRNAAWTFQRFIDQVLRNLDFVYAYIDDTLISSKDGEQNFKHLKMVFERLQKYDVVLRSASLLSTKCSNPAILSRTLTSPHQLRR